MSASADDDAGAKPGKEIPPRATLTTQWLATVQRATRQLRRDLLVTVSLLVVPLIFVAVIILLTQLFLSTGDPGIGPNVTLTNDSGSLARIFALPNYETFLFCSDPLLPAIDGLTACDDAEGNWTCAVPSSAIPVDGFCLRFVGEYAWSAVVSLFTTSLLGGLVSGASLNGIITMQWAAQAANYGEGEILPFVTAMSSLGFGVSSSTRFDSLQCSGLLFFAPANKVPANLVESLRQTYSLFQYVFGGTFETVEEAEAHIAGGSQRNWGLIQINDMETDFDVVIRLNGTALPKASIKINTDFSGAYHYDTADMYIASGFLALEKALMDFFVNTQVSQGDARATTYSSDSSVMLFSTTPRSGGTYNGLQETAGPAVGFVLVLGFMYPFCHMVQSLVLEKERRIREAIQIMGVRQVALYGSYLTTNLLLYVVVALLVTLMFRLGVTPRSDPFVLLLILLVYLASLISLAALVASWFSSERLATQLAPLVYFIMGMPIFALGFSSSGVSLGLSILSPTAFASLVSSYLELSAGAGFGPDAFENPYISPRPALTMMMLAIDCVFYGLLAAYFDAVLPRQWGTPQHPLFFIREPFSRLRACCRRDHESKPKVESGPVVPGGCLATRNPNGVFDDETPVSNGDSPTTHQDAGAGNTPVLLRQPCVEFRDVVKTYERDGKRFNALDHIWLSLYQHEVSVLLGPNGAGKSTLVDSLTGMVTPDTGDVIVCGRSATRDLHAVRQFIGLCPQHNVLWEELTCREHLEYFGEIKGFRGAALASRVLWLLEAVGLAEKVDQRSRELSGGQKRKLSVAIAFVGSEGLVILDEPTAGMDAGARRDTWRLLRQLSKTTTILLSTHFMDEADLLGDRVALINKGRLQCCGSSLFLKSRLGSGYTIRAELPSAAYARSLLGRLQQIVPAAELFSFSGREAQYGVPHGAVSRMQDVLRELETSTEQRDGVASFAVSGSTLEEVFLRLVRQHAREEMVRAAAAVAPASLVVDTHTSFALSPREPLAGAATETDQVEINGPHTWVAAPEFPEWDERDAVFTSSGYNTVGRTHQAIRAAIHRAWDAELEVSGLRIWTSQFAATWRKRWLCALRDRKLQFFQLICPVICVLIAMLLQIPTVSNNKYLALEPSAITPESQVIASLCTDWFGDNATRLSEIDEGVTVSLMSFVDSTDLSLYMLDTWFVHELPRFTAMQCNDNNIIPRALGLQDGILAPELISSLMALLSGSRIITLLHNTSTSHSAPIGVRDFFSYLTTYTATSSTDAPKVRVATHAMPANSAQRRQEKAGSVMLIAIVLCVPFILLPSTAVGWVVKERECKARHIQRLSGMTGSAYWLGNFSFDLMLYVVTCVLVTLLLTAFRRLEYVALHVLGGFVVGLLANGLCSTLYSYVLSFLFHDHATAALGSMVFNMITGIIFAIVVMVIKAIQQVNGRSTVVAQYVAFVFRIFPCYSLCEILLNLAAFDPVYQFVGGTPWTWDTLGYPLLYMAIEIPVFAVVLLILEVPCTLNTARKCRDCLKVWCCCCFQRRHRSLQRGRGDASASASPDSDVEEEARAVKAADSAEDDTDPDPVRVVGLTKVFGGRRRVVAVDDVTFAVRPGEVFSLLGTNGAGKTTTISILCQEQYPTSGHVRVEQCDTKRDRQGAMRKVGYCPQFDATIDLLTVREHLDLYAGVRGVAKSARQGLLVDLMDVCGLAQYGNVTSANLSGGNRRKLSVAIALMGAPSVVCLDEPSAGMDPVARRDLWTAVENIAGQHSTPTQTTAATLTYAEPFSRSDDDASDEAPRARCSVLLTTHHLEEVEALADRVGIMSHGKLQCIGTLPHLKDKFGTGYQLELRVVSHKAEADAEPTNRDHNSDHTSTSATLPQPHVAVAQQVMTWFPGAEQSEDCLGERLVFRLPAETTRLSDVFSLLNQHGASIGITDYIVAHTSIEQVFLRFCSEDAAEPPATSTVTVANSCAEGDLGGDIDDAVDAEEVYVVPTQKLSSTGTTMTSSHTK